MTGNQTVTYFIIKGISDVPELQAPIFVLVLLIYLIVLIGNTSLLLLVCLDSHLHTPMYFFLANLSAVDTTSANVTLHKILLTFITGDNTMHFLTCITQFYMFSVLQAQELFILMAMSYDRSINYGSNEKVILKSLSRYNYASHHIVLQDVQRLDILESLHIGTSCVKNMTRNQTVTYFIINGISDDPELQAPIFVLVLLVYLIVLVGNTSLLLLVCLDSHLHTPMYFFLANLSAVDMTSSTVTLHKILLTFITGDNTMHFIACIIQFYMFSVLQAQELFILVAMSYDRAIMEITSSIGRRKAFYTCSSHLTVIVLLYATLIFQYLIPINDSGSKKWFSLFNMAILPVLNPLIYSLRNRDIKTAFRRRIGKCKMNTFYCIEGNVIGMKKQI
ncbi:olfactory receptor 5B12-like [Dendropsophus ebraccatus]|uniref:olfactory receptor 5B12-like n=1 Tax=Dendropsophus ebraccatus TaxID=150705 RepID=UPI0038317E30